MHGWFSGWWLSSSVARPVQIWLGLFHYHGHNVAVSICPVDEDVLAKLTFHTETELFIEPSSVLVVGSHIQLDASEAFAFCSVNRCFKQSPPDALTAVVAQYTNTEHATMSLSGSRFDQDVAPADNGIVAHRYELWLVISDGAQDELLELLKRGRL